MRAASVTPPQPRSAKVPPIPTGSYDETSIGGWIPARSPEDTTWSSKTSLSLWPAHPLRHDPHAPLQHMSSAQCFDRQEFFVVCAAHAHPKDEGSRLLRLVRTAWPSARDGGNCISCVFRIEHERNCSCVVNPDLGVTEGQFLTDLHPSSQILGQLRSQCDIDPYSARREQWPDRTGRRHLRICAMGLGFRTPAIAKQRNRESRTKKTNEQRMLGHSIAPISKNLRGRNDLLFSEKVLRRSAGGAIRLNCHVHVILHDRPRLRSQRALAVNSSDDS